jgi:hypothetical protein
MNEEEKRKYEAFQYWIQTNTERGVTTIPDNLCLFVINLIKSLQKENEGLKEYIAIAPNLDEMTAVKYRNIQQDAYIKGRAEEQQRAEQIIYENYIPIQKVKDIIDRIDYDIKKTKEIISKNTNIYASYRKNDYQIVRLRAMNTKSLDIKNRLQKLLESKK